MNSEHDSVNSTNRQAGSADLGPEVLHAVLDQLYNAVIVTEARLDPPGPRIVYANAAFARQTGYSIEELIGQTPRILQGPDTDPVLLRELRRRLDRGLTYEGRTVNYRKNGEPYHVEWNISPVRDENGEVQCYISVQHDVTELLRAQSELIEKAHTDGLTGLVNRTRGEELLEHQIKLADRHDQSWSVIMADIDHFKAVNDRYGHAVGDEILKAIGRKLRRTLRETDAPMRWGGEEFLLMLPYTDHEGAMQGCRAHSLGAGALPPPEGRQHHHEHRRGHVSRRRRNRAADRTRRSGALPRQERRAQQNRKRSGLIRQARILIPAIAIRTPIQSKQTSRSLTAIVKSSNM